MNTKQLTERETTALRNAYARVLNARNFTTECTHREKLDAMQIRLMDKGVAPEQIQDALRGVEAYC